jgi:hypothetical protein
MKHTSGPWVVVDHPGENAGSDWRQIVTNAGEFSPAYIGEGVLPDALLMADAPAMLEALEIAFNALRSSAGPEERASVADTLWTLIAKHRELDQ